MIHRVKTILLLVLLPLSVTAQELGVNTAVDSVFIGERFEVEVYARVGPSTRTVFPELNEGSLALGDVEFVELVRTSSTSLDPETRVDSAVYEVAVFGVDSVLVGGLNVAFIRAEGDTLIRSTPLVPVGIRSTVPPDASGIKDLAPLVAFPYSIWMWIALGLLLAVLIWLLLWFIRRRRQPPSVGPDLPSVQIDPYDEAMGRLTKLEPPTSENEKEIQRYYVELSDILRSYIERTVDVPALERTTGELMRALEQLSNLSQRFVTHEVLGSIRRALTVSDLAKFAKHRPGPLEHIEAREDTRESIDTMENARRARTSAPEPEEA